MTQEHSLPINDEAIQLSEEEAAGLASELKTLLREGKLGDSDTAQIQRMVAGLGDPRGLLRLTFAESLGAVGASAVPALCAAMRNHQNVTVRRAAAKTLTLIGDPQSLPALLDSLLNDADPVVQGSAVGAMAAIGAESVDVLLEVLLQPEATAMQIGLASWGLSFVGAKAPEALRKAAQSEHAEIRTAAIAALGDQIQSLEDEQAKVLLMNALNDQSSDVRAEASTLLGKLHDADWAEPLLLPMIADNEPQVRKNAALSLMKLGASEATPALKEQDSLEQDPTVKSILRLAINQLNDTD